MSKKLSRKIKLNNKFYLEGTPCLVWGGLKEGEGKPATILKWGDLCGTFGAWVRPGGFHAATHIEVCPRKVLENMAKEDDRITEEWLGEKMFTEGETLAWIFGRIGIYPIADGSFEVWGLGSRIKLEGKQHLRDLLIALRIPFVEKDGRIGQ